MSLLSTLFNNETVKKQLFSKLAQQAKENGIKKLLITINEDGTFESEVLPEGSEYIKKESLDFLKDFYEKNKTKTGLNWRDKINHSSIDEIKNLDNHKK